MSRKDTKVALIRSVPLFSHCTKKEVNQLAKLADLVDVPAGHELVKEGDPLAREFMVIIDGEVEVRRGGRTVATLGSGDFFGEMALIAGGPRNATVRATVPTELLVVTPAPFHALLKKLPSLQASVLRALAERLQANAV
jgi:CRP/FNR family transcriptional regulator, cyclic AMP receptor protein